MTETLKASNIYYTAPGRKSVPTSELEQRAQGRSRNRKETAVLEWGVEEWGGLMNRENDTGGTGWGRSTDRGRSVRPFGFNLGSREPLQDSD